jgi:hypothetical protein
LLHLAMTPLSGRAMCEYCFRLVVRPKPRRVPLRTLDDEREVHPLTALFGSLQAQKIRFIAAKEFIGRDKDLAQLPVLRAVLRNLGPAKS